MTFILYCICGAMGVTTDYLTYFALVSMGVWYQGANALGYAAGTILSFALNRLATFKMKDDVLRRLAMFIAVALCGYLVSALALWFLVSDLSVNAKIGKLITLPFVVVIQYFLNSRFSFRPKNKFS